ncbi:unnamed protein product [Caenorhabditis sp. 36 PRJEB53466]|nr:unnamed protein product [Caenorhabditis sp. 36 PRJEB53466]
MRSQFSSIGLAYFVLVANFYYQSNGFNDHFTLSYSFWKVTPIILLAAFAYLNGGGLGKEERKTAAIGLVFGGVGDWVIGMHQDGIILGAFAFGLGHLCYLSLFRHHETKIHNKFLLGMLAWAVVIGQLCLLPLLPEHKGPVAVFALYSLLLSTCTFIAVSQYLNGSSTQNEEGLLYRAIGFTLFYISDSVLIMSHTGVWKLAPSLIVLSTYYSAQYLILYGNSLAAVKVQKMLSPAQCLAIYGGSTLLAYIETSSFEKNHHVLLSLPLVVLTILTLATTMNPKTRIATALSFLMSAVATYFQSVNRTAPTSAVFYTISNVFYYLSYRDLVGTVSSPILLLSVFLSFGHFLHLLQDLLVAIPFLATILTILLASHVCILATSASVCQNGQHGDFDARQASLLRLFGAILSWLSAFLLIYNSFQTHTKLIHSVSRIIFYLANSMLFFANERAF